VPSSQHDITVKRGELAFDNAISLNDFERAQVIARDYMDVLSTQTSHGIYPPGLARFALKEVALPLYGRAIYDATHSPEVAEMSPENAYKDSVALLEYFKNWADSLPKPKPGDQDELANDIEGTLSELTIFSLTARDIQGLPEDPLTILPSMRTQDSTPHLRSFRKNPNFDFVVRRRARGTVIPLQVKTSLHYNPDEYRPSIAIVSTVDIAGGRVANQKLRLALIADSHGQATEEQVELIESSKKKLDLLYENHFRRFGNKALTATNL